MIDVIVRRALGGPGDGGMRGPSEVVSGGSGSGALQGLSPAIEPPMGKTPWDPLLNVNAVYSGDPTVPDPLPPLVNYSHDFPDTDERVAHNYPGEPIEWRNRGRPMTALQQAFSTRGYGDMPRANGKFGAADVTNSVTLPNGLLPMFGRTAPGPLTIDPLDGMSFKPPKTVVTQSDMRESPAVGWNVWGNKWNGTQQLAYVEPNTKWRSGRGAYNDAWPSQVGPDGRVSCCDGDGDGDGTVNPQGYGFSTGEQLVAQTGSEHWGNKRIWREVPNQRKMLYFRIGNPSTAVGRFMSEWAQGTGPLGETSVNYNVKVRDYHREPMPTAGLTADRLGAHELVVMPFSNRTGCPPPGYAGNTIYQRDDGGGMMEASNGNGNGNGNAGAYGYAPTQREWFGAKNSQMHSQEALRLHNEYRDVIPNKTTQFPLGSGFPVATSEMKGPTDSNPVRLRPTHRSCYQGARNAVSDPAPFYASGNPAVYNTEYVIDPHNIKEIGAGYRMVYNRDSLAASCIEGRDDGCMVAGTNRPGGPSLPLDSTADRWAVDRVNTAYARPCLKEQLIDQCAVRPPQSDVYYAPQRGDFPAPENRRVTPFIQQEIDASLLQALQQNPYSQPIPCDA